MSILTQCSQVSSTKKKDAELVAKIKSWTDLNYNLPKLDVDEVARLIHLEYIGQNRWPALRRLLGRYNRLRLEVDLVALQEVSQAKAKRK